mmetsp:Transcript_38744/g.72704  ORF Transcript_38744/g.72704 Transcript_38744/m.72704 type:complete len:446 (+) Transcript_38744:152-1489(+)
MHREANAEAKDVGAKKRRRVFPEDQGRGKPPCKTRRHKASSIGPVDGQDTVHVPARALLKEFGQAKLQRLRTKHISCSVQHQNQDMQLITRRYIGHYMKRVGQAVSGKKAPLNFVRAAHLGRCKGEQTWASRGLLLQWLESFGASKKLPTQGGIPVLPSGALGDVELARAREDEVAIVVARLPDARKRLHFYITSPVNTQMLVVIGEEKRVGSGRFQYRLSRSVGQALGRASREMCERGLSSVRTVTNWLKSRINASKHSTCLYSLVRHHQLMSRNQPIKDLPCLPDRNPISSPVSNIALPVMRRFNAVSPVSQRNALNPLLGESLAGWVSMRPDEALLHQCQAWASRLLQQVHPDPININQTMSDSTEVIAAKLCVTEALAILEKLQRVPMTLTLLEKSQLSQPITIVASNREYPALASKASDIVLQWREVLRDVIFKVEQNQP